MRTLILALSAVLMAGAGTGPAEAGGRGWGAGHTVGWSKARYGSPHRYAGFHRDAVAVGDIGPSGRYLSDSSWYLSDIGGYLTDDPPYPGPAGYSYGYGGLYPGYTAPVRHHRRSASAIAVRRTLHGPRRVVTVHYGASKRIARR